ncbi:MAG: hypothetical protein LBG17_02820 [Bacteroidales bacterium]|jgi:hypothetical protein|nr:hypothetical protein [Bacteroidales bacterium]
MNETKTTGFLRQYDFEERAKICRYLSGKFNEIAQIEFKGTENTKKYSEERSNHYAETLETIIKNCLLGLSITGSKVEKTETIDDQRRKLNY